MQFQSIIAILAMGVAATAAPSPNSAPATAPQCAAGQTTACCSSSLSGVLPISLPCTVVNVISLLNPNCPSNQQLACCDSGAQTGDLIAVGALCVPLSLS